MSNCLEASEGSECERCGSERCVSERCVSERSERCYCRRGIRVEENCNSCSEDLFNSRTQTKSKLTAPKTSNVVTREKIIPLSLITGKELRMLNYTLKIAFSALLLLTLSASASRNHNRRLQAIEFKDAFPPSLLGTFSGTLKVLNVLDKNETSEVCLPTISPLTVPHYIIFEKNTLGNITFTDGANSETFVAGGLGLHYPELNPESYYVVGFNSANGLLQFQFLDDIDGSFKFCKQILAPMTLRTVISMDDSCLPATYKNSPQLLCSTENAGTANQMTMFSYTGQYSIAQPSASPSFSPSRSPFPSFDANLFQNLMMTKLPQAQPTDMTNSMPSFPAGLLPVDDIPSPGSVISASPSKVPGSFFFPSPSNTKAGSGKLTSQSSGASSLMTSSTVLYTLSGGFLIGALLGNRMRLA